MQEFQESHIWIGNAEWLKCLSIRAKNVAFGLKLRNFTLQMSLLTQRIL